MWRSPISSERTTSSRRPRPRVEGVGAVPDRAYRMLADDPDHEPALEALELARTFGLVELEAHGLITIGTGLF